MDKRSVVVLAVGLAAILAANSLQIDFKKSASKIRAEYAPEEEIASSSVSDDPPGEPWEGPKDDEAEEAPNPDIVQDPDSMPTPKKDQASDHLLNSNHSVNSDPMPPTAIDPTPNKKDPSDHTLFVKKHGVSGSYVYFRKKSVSSDEVSHLFVVHEVDGDIYIEGDMPDQMREFVGDLSKYGDVVVQSSILD